ncbi:MAG: acylneuraminate cytidylyltransferase family protein [Omnitrophica bacterium]|nr:acylneuraminate cytidylyltransferase family protein [Candidatus Omnitrophota bacterium]
MKIVALIPARRGSKGVPGKNVRLFAGKPLIAWTIEHALRVPQIERLICSTDDSNIAQIARSYGCEVPFMRSKSLAKDDVPGIEVALHAIDFIKTKEQKPCDTIVYLQCTSPCRTSESIACAIKMYMQSHVKNLISVCEAEHSPYLMLRMNPEGRLEKIMKNDLPLTQRQDLPKAYRPNGAIYISDAETIMRTRSFYEPEPLAFVMEKRQSVDIDDEFDFELAEFLYRKA